MSNIRLKKGQVDPKNPQATSVRGAAKLNTVDISKVDISSKKTAPEYLMKKVNYHYSCPECNIPFIPVKTTKEMDSQVAAHDCDNPTMRESSIKRDMLKNEIGYTAYSEKLDFKPNHKECKSYQTSCVDCAEEHELKLYEIFTRKELSLIVRPDSMFADPSVNKHMGEDNQYVHIDVMSVIHEFPASESWNYLPDKSGMQLELEQKGINISEHLDKNDICKICGSHVLDMYCMDCFTPGGYLIEEGND